MEVDMKTIATVGVLAFLLSFVVTFLYEGWKDREFWKEIVRTWK